MPQDKFLHPKLKTTGLPQAALKVTLTLAHRDGRVLF